MSEVTHRKSSGSFQAMGLWGELMEGATLSCRHCQYTWVLQKGSGQARGFCTKCMGYVCGPGCYECVPFERRIENIEAGRPETTPAPALILVPGGIDLIDGA